MEIRFQKGIVEVEVTINNETKSIETVVVNDFANDLIIGLDGLDKFKETRESSSEKIVQWTANTFYKLEPGRFGKASKTGKVASLPSKTTIKEAILHKVDRTDFADRWCKESIARYTNHVKDYTLKRTEISEEKLEEARAKFLRMIEDISTTKLTDLKPTGEVRQTINLTDHTTFHIRTRPVPYAKKEEFKKLIDEMLAANLIRSSNSPYSSPVHLVINSTEA
jgi:hypothetical protein